MIAIRVAEAERLGQVVRDEDHRLARLLLEPHHLVLHVAADQRVEGAERLVVEHHGRVADERPRHADALLHAAGELVGERVLDVLEPDQPQHLARLREPLRLRRPRGSRGRRRRCRSRGGARAARSAGRPSRRSCGAARAAADPLAPITSWPAISIAPAVGSIRRISVRTSVDLPEPERPMTTNTSPGQTSSETSLTAATQPVLARSSERGSSASGVPMMLSAFGPKIFQTPLARMMGSTPAPFDAWRAGDGGGIGWRLECVMAVWRTVDHLPLAPGMQPATSVQCRERRQRRSAGERRVRMLGLDPQQPVPFRRALGARRGADLELPCPPADREVGEPAVLGLARAGREHGRVPGLPGDLDDLAGIAQRPHLVGLDEHRVRDPVPDAGAQPHRAR